MSKVYIEGMEMPKSCIGCILCKVHNGGESASCRIRAKDLSVDDFFNKKPIFCPLREVE